MLPPDGQAALLARLPPAERARVFRHLDPGRQDALLGRLPEPVLRELFAGLPADERADLFKRLDEPRRARLLPALGRAEREDLLRLAAYPEGSVGSVTTTGMVALPPALTVRETFACLRALAPRAETLGVLYAVDEGSRLLGTVSLRELVLADEEARIGELMRPDPVAARPEWPRAEAAELIRRHDPVAPPVVDGEGRLIGIVTVDDAMDIEKAEEAATLTRFGGSVAATGGPDLDLLASPLRRLFGVRAFWLAVLSFFGVLTSSFVAAQEELLAQAIVLAAFIAPIIDMGGNAGSQSATLVIRSMALGQLAPRARDLLLLLRRELPVAAALGLCIALLEAVLGPVQQGGGPRGAAGGRPRDARLHAARRPDRRGAALRGPAHRHRPGHALGAADHLGHGPARGDAVLRHRLAAAWGWARRRGLSAGRAAVSSRCRRRVRSPSARTPGE
ncbi:MAG: CBS domain-containing protein [Xanthomonadales bacterium]|nr:CBS domain-containing protein [Xanthomonadales bacterium]